MSANKSDALSIVESYKAIRQKLLAVFGEHTGCRVFCVTSPATSEGKTTTAINVAIAFSQLGKRVLLIDGDMHRGSVHKKLRLSSLYGLCDLLSESCDLSSAIVSAGSSLDVIVAGAPKDDAEALLSSESFENLLSGLKYVYDYIIIDTPSVCEYKDAVSVAARTDGAVLVLREGVSLHKKISAAFAMLQSAGVNILGTVMNGAKR